MPKKISGMIVCCLSMVILVFSGCGNQQSLGGKITYSDDGSPVTQGAVVFVSATVQSQAAIKPDGTFVVGTYKADDGLPPGNYAVSVVGVETVEIKKSDSGQQTEIHTSLIDEKYSNGKTSGLTFNADGKTKTIDIKVDRAKK